MKMLAGVALAALLLAGAAAAQTPPAAPGTAPAVALPPPPPSHCGTIPPAPQLPDGASANANQMTAGNTAYQAWANDAQAKINCRRAEVEAIVAQAISIRDQFNQSVVGVNGTTTAWQASVDAYNARHNNNNNNNNDHSARH